MDRGVTLVAGWCVAYIWQLMIPSALKIEAGNTREDIGSIDNGIYFISFSSGENELSNQTLIKY